eukprot:INCI5385.1.p1 GENE.INCI5385.1~~INCI5385.1.p1  ORF type:complete len:121 (+),score=14.27 INCI5385.1:146-508(+)
MDPYLEMFSSLRCHHAAPLVLHGDLGQKVHQKTLSLAQKVSPLAPLEVPPSSQTASGLPREWIARRLVGSTEMLTSMNDEIRVQLQLLYSQYLCRFFPKRPLVRFSVDRSGDHFALWPIE